MEASGWLHVSTLKGGRYYKWDLAEIADRHTPVIENKEILVVKIVELVFWVLSITPLPFEHDRSIMRSLRAPVLFYFIKTGGVITARASLTREV